MMMASEDSNIPVNNEFDFAIDIDADGDDDFGMDVNELYKILDEGKDEKDDLSNLLMENAQEGGPNLNLIHDEDAIDYSGYSFDANMGNGAASDCSAETMEVQGPFYPTPSDMHFVSHDSSITSTPGVLGDSFYSCSREEVNDAVSKPILSSTAHYPCMPPSSEYLMDTNYKAANFRNLETFLGKDMSPELERGSYASINFPGMDQLGSASNSINAALLSGIDSHDTLSTFTDGVSRLPLHWIPSPLPNRRQPVMVEKTENKPMLFSKGPRYGTYSTLKDIIYRKHSFGSGAGNFAMNAVTSEHDKKYGAVAKSESQDNFFDSGAHHVFDNFGQSGSRYLDPPIYDEYVDAKSPLNLASLDTLPSAGFGFTKGSVEMAKMTHSTIASSATADIKPQPFIKPSTYIEPHPVQVSSMDDDDDDPDVCIIEKTDIHARFPPWADGRYQLSSQASSISSENTELPKQVASFQSFEKSVATFQNSSFSTAIIPVVADSMKPKAIDERLIFQEAVQDILSQDVSQSHSETTPPDGLMSVPLLRHQRIALSWMVKKETVSWHCCGGILADDQGLGKTISTIALILTERAVPFKPTQSTKIIKHETLDLDEIDDQDTKGSIVKDSDPRNGNLVKSPDSCSPSKGRPAGGTLIVCPTSVIRQWAAELRSKVTSKANLLVCMYHGGSRTKDPFELAKYDVVLTTYSIVSMEVRKQSSKDEEEKLEADDTPPFFFKKRKNSSKSSDRCSKKGKDNSPDKPECPLERVRWFRVVLDEAQSIKNFRTRVAHACWALRAKRRWCLSGTPLQNVVDDLYSYFRFLRYDPYTTYNAFHELVKLPISKTPTQGYQKLQAVLKAIMLRRTKATLIDGEPIVNLPPKSVVLNKVEFSTEERDFYCKLEADSRARFAEYEADGTVEKNYVNILVMLLRLRQACNHPFLVQGFDSRSVWSSSVDAANKLPQEEKLSLLTCLEASLAICGICNDSPEDAVVSRCGHVFCNQCISGHFIGDDKQCPAKNCKVQINKSCVFSRATLKRCLDEGLDNSSVDTSSHSSPCSEVIEPSQAPQLHHSTKVKAALQVLQSLNKPLDVGMGNSCERPVKVEQSDNASSQTTVPQTGSSGVAPTIEVKGSIIKIRTGSSNPVSVHKNSVTVHKEKTIVFSQWVKMLDLLEPCLKESSIQFRRLDGTMTVHARDKAVQDFNTLPEVTVMIMSLKAASLGLNLVVANHVLLMDLWWNPTTEDQAIDRAHRIGQTRPVSVVRLTVADTVEDRILALQEKKREMVASAFGEDKAGSRSGRLAVEDLRYLFRM